MAANRSDPHAESKARTSTDRNWLLTLLVIARDSAEFLPGLISDLVAQTADPRDYEVLFVIDPATKDQSFELLENAARKLRASSQVMRAHQSSLAAGWNEGISQSQGDYIARWDAHGRYPRTWIAHLLARLKVGHPHDIVGGPVILKPFRPSSRNAQAISNAENSFLVSGAISPFKRQHIGRAEMETHFVARAAYHQSVYRAVGLYRRLPFACEDVELAHRARKHGYRFVLNPALTSVHFARVTPSAFAMQKFRNGAAVMSQLAHGVLPTHPAKLVPAIFLAFLGILCAIAVDSRLASLSMAFVPAIVLATTYGAIRSQTPQTYRARTALMILLANAAYATGSWYALIHYFFNRRAAWPPVPSGMTSAHQNDSVSPAVGAAQNAGSHQ